MAKDTKEKKTASPAKRKTKAARGKQKWIKISIITLSVIALLFLGVYIAYHAIVDHYLDKVNVVTKETNLVFETEVITSEGIDEVVEEIEKNGELNADNLPLICDTKNVKNILLLAVDSRGKNDAGRTDSMIMVSINSKTGKIVLCSFMRDILAAYPKEPTSPVAGSYDKLNHAHAYGGPELTMAVLKETFNIEVDHYAKVDFSAFRDIVDAMGGIDMELSSAEARAINSILLETMQEDANKALKVTSKDLLKSTKAGTYHLTGVQALSHARNRRVGSDYARTQRQRDLIAAMASQAKSLSLSQLDTLLSTVLPLITTNMPRETMKDMIGDLPSYLSYEINSTRVPADGMFTERNYNIIPDLERNCFALYELIYGEKAPGAPKGTLPPATTRRPVTTTTAPPVTTTTPTTGEEKEPVTGEPETEDPSTQKPPTQDPTQKDPTEKDPTEQDPTEKDPTQKDPTEKDPTEQDPTQKDPTEKDPTEKDPDEKDPEETPDTSGSTPPAVSSGTTGETA